MFMLLGRKAFTRKGDLSKPGVTEVTAIVWQQFVGEDIFSFRIKPNIRARPSLEEDLISFFQLVNKETRPREINLPN